MMSLVASPQPTIRANSVSVLIDDVIRLTPEYQPHQICKDFVKQHGLRLTYNQAWHLKEKAIKLEKNRIFMKNDKTINCKNSTC